MREAFQAWIGQQPYRASTKNTIWYDAGRIERSYGDLDEAYDRDKFAALLAELKYSKEDERASRANPSKLEIDGDIYSGLASYRAKLTYYSRFRESEAQASRPLNQAELENLKRRFLQLFPDFESLGFQAERGGYWDGERAYKEDVLAGAREILAREGASAEEVGRDFLALIQRPPANFVGWRAFDNIKDAGAEASRAVAAAIGEMLTSEDEVTSLAATCAATIHPLIMGGTLGNPAYGNVRTLVTTVLAFARPHEAIAVKTRFMQRWARKLTGRRILKTGVMTRGEYEEVLAFAEALGKVMREQWGWTPRDLWDVQGFLWATSEWDLNQVAEEHRDDEEPASTETDGPIGLSPTNLILHGPPGTGKMSNGVQSGPPIGAE